MPNVFNTPSDVFQSTVYGDTIVTNLYALASLFGNPYVREIEGAIWNSGGSTVTFPTWQGGLTAVALANDGTCPDYQKVTAMSSTTKDVISKIVPVSILNAVMEDAMARYKISNGADMSFFDMISREVALAISVGSGGIDKDLITEAETTTASVDISGEGAGLITIDSISDAKALFKDRGNVTRGVLIVHSKVMNDIRKLEDVRKNLYWGANPVSKDGNVSQLMGYDIMVSDNVSVSNGVYNNILLRDRGLGIGFKRNVTHRIVPIPGDQDLHEFTVRYVCKLFTEQTIPGAVLIKTKTATA